MLYIFLVTGAHWMSSALVWSTESVVLGLWALVFSSYSTPLHVFVARSHILASSFTLILHLYVKARDLVVGPAVSHAFVCFVTSLFLCYITVLFADGSDTNPKYFKMPSVGLLTLDACIGLAWFLAAIISSFGMVLSGRESDEADTGSGRMALMFHMYGFHLVAVFPCLALPLLVKNGIGFDSSGLAFLIAVIWIVYIVFMVAKAIGSSIPFFSETMDFWRVSTIGKIGYLIQQLCTKFFLVFVTVLMLLTFGNVNQRILIACLVVISCAKALDTVLYIPFLGLKLLQIPNIPTIDEYFGRRWRQIHGQNDGAASSSNETAGRVPCNCCCFLPQGSTCACPVQVSSQSTFPVDPPTAPPANVVLSNVPPPPLNTTTQSMFQLSLPPLTQRQVLRFNPADPAAVSISRKYLSGDGREKNV